jgi:hypothetical protein
MAKAEKLKNLLEEAVKKPHDQLKENLPGMLESIRDANLGVDDAMETINLLGGLTKILDNTSVDNLNAIGKDLKDIIPTLIPMINETIQTNIKKNKDIHIAFSKIKHVTVGIDMIEMGIALKARFTPGLLRIEHGLEGADLTILLPTSTLMELPYILSDGMQGVLKLFTGKKLRIKGSMMKALVLAPLFSAAGKIVNDSGIVRS